MPSAGWFFSRIYFTFSETDVILKANAEMNRFDAFLMEKHYHLSIVWVMTLLNPKL